VRRAAVAFTAGAATVLAFSPAAVYPVALASFGVLIHLWMRASPGRCFVDGFWFGLGLFGAGVSWVYVSLNRFGGMPAALAAIATLGFCAFLALFASAAGWLQARIPARDGVRACVLVPAAWTLSEWLRGWILTGFPWLSVGYAATGWPPGGIAPITGVYGLTLLTLACAGLVWLLSTGPRKPLALVGLAAVMALGQALRLVAWTSPAGSPVSIALLQGNIAQDMKFVPERYPRTLETYARLAEETPARLIVLPETAIPRFYHAIEPAFLARLEDAARRNGGDLVLGVPMQLARNDYFNSALTLGTAPRQAYHKVHLVPFGEFVPPGFGWVLHVLRIPLSDFARGAPNQPPLQVAGQRVAVNICYEDAFGEEMARRAAGATLLVNMSNVAWFGDSLAPGQHLQIARLRALETGRSHLAATNTGITAAIDRDGRVLAQLPQFAEGRLEVAVQGYDGETPYMRYGDWPALLAAALALVLAVALARMRPRRDNR
jgi:apolipoprotein N-acyltransferase